MESNYNVVRLDNMRFVLKFCSKLLKLVQFHRIVSEQQQPQKDSEEYNTKSPNKQVNHWVSQVLLMRKVHALIRIKLQCSEVRQHEDCPLNLIKTCSVPPRHCQ